MLSRAVALHRSGRLDEAEKTYRELLRLSPNAPDVLHYLGLIAFQRGLFPDAVRDIGAAINAWGEFAPPECHVNYGNALKRTGNMDAARLAYERAVALRHDFSAAWYNLFLLHLAAGRNEQAGLALSNACEATSPIAEALISRGEREITQGNDATAIVWFERALAAGHQNQESLIRIATALLNISRYGDALKILDAAHREGAADPRVLNAKGCALIGLGRLGEAIKILQALVQLEPGNFSAIDNLATALKDAGRNQEAMDLYRALLVKEGISDRTLLSNYLLTSLYSDRITPRELIREHREICEILFSPSMVGLRQVTDAKAALINESAVLNVGYLSGDFHNHPVAYFISGILGHHDRSRVNVFAYDNGAICDEWTAKLKRHVLNWRQVRSLSDSELAALIQRDRIDVLVDLAGHTANGRLSVLCHRPAPVQVSYLGYPFSTGASFVDWRIVDVDTDPLGDECLSSERLFRLSRSYYAYSPPENAPEVSSLPALKNGYLTFGVSGNLAKVSPTALDRWAAVLNSFPGSRLRWRSKAFSDTLVKKKMVSELVVRGVQSKRIKLETWAPHADRFAFFGGVDVVLDTIPYNQATNTCEALWMGVPTLSWRDGNVHQARMGSSLLNAAGLGEWSVADVSALPGLLGDFRSLSELRRGLRQRLESSSLFDCADAARQLENAYSAMAIEGCHQ